MGDFSHRKSPTNITFLLANFRNWHSKWKVLTDISEVDELSFTPCPRHRWLSPALPGLPGVLPRHHCSHCALPETDFYPQHCSSSLHSTLQLYWEGLFLFHFFFFPFLLPSLFLQMEFDKKTFCFSILCFSS